MDKNKIIASLRRILGNKYLITANWKKQSFSKGWRYGEGEALAVAKPGSLVEIWRILQICVEFDVIVIMQAANTGLTGGSTPYGNDYDRPILIINTMRINGIHVINDGSTDATEKLAKEIEIIVISHKKNEGLGSAVRTGLLSAININADIVIKYDADLQHEPFDILNLIEPITSSEKS